MTVGEGPVTGQARLLAVSDLHVAYQENRTFVEELGPTSPGTG